MRKTLTTAIACLAVGVSTIPKAALAQRYARRAEPALGLAVPAE